MARFRGTVQGARGIASRLGHSKSGLEVKANGWHVGIRVAAMPTEDKDEFSVWLTAGSNHDRVEKLIGVFGRADFDRLK